ncbi:MAG: thiamine phosphate synthase [Caulobacteraceae bacterium]
MGRDLERLMRTARTLSRRTPSFTRRDGRRQGRLPPLILVTDPDRTPDPIALAERLPKGCGVIFRGFGRKGAGKTARRLAAVARRRGLVLLIGADAVRVKGAGAHLPERMAYRAGVMKRSRPGALVTVAAHSLQALIRARKGGADAALLSTVFESRSPSAGQPLGAVRFAALVRQAGLPVYALGGVKTKNAPRLRGSGAAGLAMVEGLAKALK